MMLDQIIAGISFDNPFVAASGCFGFGMEYKDLFDPNILGAITLKTLTLDPCLPLPAPRVAEVSCGILHKIGWENPGLEAFLKITRLAIEKNLLVPIILSLGGALAQDYAQLAERLSAYSFVKAFELDVSSFHTPAEFFSEDQILDIVNAVKQVSSCPFFVKLRADQVKKDFIEALEKCGISGLSLINSPRGMEFDSTKQTSILGKGQFGSLSGPIIKPFGLKAVFDARQYTRLPIIAMGGVVCLEDALEYFFMGANLVAIGSGFFKEPLCAVDLIQKLPLALRKCGVEHISSLVAKAI